MVRQESHRIHLQALQGAGSGGGGGGGGGGGAIDETSTASSWDDDGASLSSGTSLTSLAFSLVKMGRGATTVATTTSSTSREGDWADEEKIVTQSTVVRLSDAAKTADVTRVLRKKFGLGMVEGTASQPAAATTTTTTGSGTKAVSRINQRLHQLRKTGSGVGSGDSQDKNKKTTTTSAAGAAGPTDVLVLVGTLTSVPQGYIRFEHEEPAPGTAPEPAEAAATTAAASANEGSSSSPPSNPKANSMATASNTAASNEVLLNTSFDTTASQFHSEPLTVLEIRSDQPSDTDAAASPTTPAASGAPVLEPPRFGEPVHLIRTLQPHERPLTVRDELYQQLLRFQQEAHDQMGTTQGPDVAPPVVTWYFQPDPQTTTATTTAPSTLQQQQQQQQQPQQQQHRPMGCLILDGYSTEVEEEDSQHDEESSKQEQKSPDLPAKETLSWKEEMLRRHGAGEGGRGTYSNDADWRERHKMALLSQYEAALDNHCVSGFLLHQSSRHVWKRVHCVLTQDSFWFVFRSKRQERPTAPSGNHMRKKRLLGRHVVLSLQAGATVSDPSSASASCGRRQGHIPFGFCLTCPSGCLGGDRQVHVFRATSGAARDRWVQCLESRIRHCQESHFMESAQLLIKEDTRRRSSRIQQHCKHLLLPTTTGGPSAEQEGEEEKEAAPLAPPAGAIDRFRFAEGVEEYKEACRHWESLSPRLQGNGEAFHKKKQAFLCHTWQVANRVVHRKCMPSPSPVAVVVTAQQEALVELIAPHVDPQEAQAVTPEIEVSPEQEATSTSTQNPTQTTISSTTTTPSLSLDEAPPADLLDELLQGVCQLSVDQKDA